MMKDITGVSWYMYIQRVCIDILSEKQQRVKRRVYYGMFMWCFCTWLRELLLYIE